MSLEAVNIRDYAGNRYGKVDDYPYGGGAGMVMQAEPVYAAVKDLEERMGHKPRVIYLTPQGSVFRQEMAVDFAKEEDLVFLCGHYEGIDERVLEEVVTDYVSIGDYVLTGGELPAMVMIDAISRMVPGVLSNGESGTIESFHDNLLEYPQYSRPEVWRDKAVPPVLLSGHHANVEKWRREESIRRTLERRAGPSGGCKSDGKGETVSGFTEKEGIKNDEKEENLWCPRPVFDLVCFLLHQEFRRLIRQLCRRLIHWSAIHCPVPGRRSFIRMRRGKTNSLL